jgi:hypothetical protein
MIPNQRHSLCLALLFVLFVPRESRGEEPETQGLRLQIVPIERGNRESSFGNVPERFATTAVYKAAEKSGIDLRQPEHPLLVYRYDAGRLFYLFYNDVVNVPDGRYLIQRVKRTTINHSSDGESTSQVAYLVEALKSAGGRSKRPDQHFGSFSLQGYERREIIKEFDVGLGEIAGIAEGEEWPFEPGKLFHRIQNYGENADTFDRVKFQESVHWTIRVSFDRNGNYELSCPELGVELVRTLPPAPGDDTGQDAPAVARGPDGKVEADPATVDVVLQEGVGALGVVVGETRLAEAQRQLGEPVDMERLKAAANYHFAQRITLNIPAEEPVNTLFTRPGFGGRTGKGVHHGDTRDKVRDVYGSPDRSTSATATFDGVIFWFDEGDRVSKIVIYRSSGRIE